LKFQGLAYRAHDPRWSFKPLSGEGAALHGGRFNPKGTPALYLSLDPMTAIKEAAQGFAHKFEPYVLCTYEIDCEDVIDLRDEEERRAAGVGIDVLACPWFAEAAAGREPASWLLARKTYRQRRGGPARTELRPRSKRGGRRQSRLVVLEQPTAAQGRGLRPERSAAKQPALMGLTRRLAIRSPS
jgi:RES domain-containing protein